MLIFQLALVNSVMLLQRNLEYRHLHNNASSFKSPGCFNKNFGVVFVAMASNGVSESCQKYTNKTKAAIRTGLVPGKFWK